MTDAKKFSRELEALESALKMAGRVLITAPSSADGDSVGSQLALRRMIHQRFPGTGVTVLNDEPLPERYRFMKDVVHVHTPETWSEGEVVPNFDVAIIVDGGIDRAGRVKELYDRAAVKVFIDHHAVSVDYPYNIKIVEPEASSTTELVYHLSQTSIFETPVDREFAQQIYLGLIFDTGFFRHSNTTPEAMELAARLLRTGFDFTRVGERGMLERSYASLQLLSDTLRRSCLIAEGRIIFSILTQAKVREFGARDDDQEGIIDHLFLTQGIDVAILFYELPEGETRISLRSHGEMDVARFARNLTKRGGGHRKAAGANLEIPIERAVEWVLTRLESSLPEANPARPTG